MSDFVPEDPWITSASRADMVWTMYKSEYERCAIRYEDIYKSIWSQFNYFIVAAGAILAFGKDKLGPEILVMASVSPLIFWFWGTYEPLNRYGDQVALRASQIEQIISRQLLGHTPELGVKGVLREPIYPGMHHFREYVSSRRKDSALVWSRKRKVGLAIGMLSLIVAVVSVTLIRLSRAVPHKGNTQMLTNWLKPLQLWLPLTFLVMVVIASFLLAVHLFGEKFKVPMAVRFVVRFSASVLHAVLAAALMAYLAKLSLGLSTGPAKSDAPDSRFLAIRPTGVFHRLQDRPQ